MAVADWQNRQKSSTASLRNWKKQLALPKDWRTKVKADDSLAVVAVNGADGKHS